MHPYEAHLISQLRTAELRRRATRPAATSNLRRIIGDWFATTGTRA